MTKARWRWLVAVCAFVGLFVFFSSQATKDHRPDAAFECGPGPYYPSVRCQSKYTTPHPVRWHIYPDADAAVTLSGAIVSWEPEPGATYRVVGEVNRGGVIFEQELVVER